MNLAHKLLSLAPGLWKLRPNGLYAFNYHRIGEASATKFDPNVFSCNEELFEQHIKFYNENFTVISLEDLTDISSLRLIKDKYALLTFDDGYIDNYQLAYPLLKASKTPATFFIATDFIDKEVIPWWDEIAFLIQQSKNANFYISDLSTPININRDDIAATIKETLTIIKLDNRKNMSTKLQDLRKALGFPCDFKCSSERLFMTWDMLREMQKNGMTIGSQSCSHQILSHLNESEQTFEAQQSKLRLEQELGIDIEFFAYPVGGESAFTEITERILMQSGYSMGFSFMPGINRNVTENLYKLKRFSIDNNASDKVIKSSVIKTMLSDFL